jgi:hypothetical protein
MLSKGLQEAHLSLNNFIPEIWADSMIVNLRKNQVFGALFNTDYQGEISAYGDTVRISAIGVVTISNYVKDTDMAAPQSLTDAQTMLTISQAKSYNFLIDDVDKAQSNPKVMAQAMSDAGYQMADTMDLYYSGFYTDAQSANLIGSSGSFTTVTVPTAANIGAGTTLYDNLVLLSQKLTEAKIPKQGRWCVCPPWGKSHLTMDARFTGFNTASARLTILSGKLDASAGNASDAYLGRIENMDIYESLNAPHIGGTVGASGSQDVFFAGHSMGLTKAEGLREVEAYRPERRFGDAVKGLMLYGAKTIRPDAIAVAYLQKP